MVPKLRFPEFRTTGEWKEYRLDDIAERITEKVGSELHTTLSITAGVGFVSQAEKFSRDISGMKYENYILLKEGEFSYNKGNSKRFPQGCIYKLKEYKKAAVPNVFLSFRFNKNYVSDFYKGYFDNNFHGIQLIKFITSGARSDGLLNINPTDFFSIILPTPPEKPEQQKIADCLTSLDELITAEAGKLEAYKAHKKGLMQKLFPAEGKTIPEWRFPEFRGEGEWEEETLEKEAAIVMGASPKSEFYNEENNGLPLLQGNADIRNRVSTPRVFTSQITKECQKGDILLSVRAPVGTIAKSIHHACIGRGIAAIRANKDNSQEFLYQSLFAFESQWQNISQGGTFDAVNSDDIRQLATGFPSKPEQQKIADCLTSLDELITAQAKKIDTLKSHKKGLMQGLFPCSDEVDYEPRKTRKARKKEKGVEPQNTRKALEKRKGLNHGIHGRRWKGEKD